MSRIGKKPIAIPKGVTVKIEGNTVAGAGAQGQAGYGSSGRHQDGAERRKHRRHPRERFAGGAAWTGARAGQQRRRRRHQGLDARTGDRRHRLPRRDEGQGHGGVQPGLFASRSNIRCLPASMRRSIPSRPRLRSRESTASRLDRSRPKCARCVRPIRTRTRVCAMRARD